MNITIISGYLMSDPQLLTSKAGHEYSMFALSNKTGYGESKNNNYFNCICYGNNAKNIAKYKHKGDFISVIGEINIKQYDGNDGTKKTSVQITVNSLDFPPATKVSSNNIDIDYDQNVNNNVSFTQEQVGHETGMDGYVNPQQFMESQKKPYKPYEKAFDTKNVNPNISADDLPF